MTPLACYGALRYNRPARKKPGTVDETARAVAESWFRVSKVSTAKDWNSTVGALRTLCASDDDACALALESLYRKGHPPPFAPAMLRAAVAQARRQRAEQERKQRGAQNALSAGGRHSSPPRRREPRSALPKPTSKTWGQLVAGLYGELNRHYESLGESKYRHFVAWWVAEAFVLPAFPEKRQAAPAGAVERRAYAVLNARVRSRPTGDAAFKHRAGGMRRDIWIRSTVGALLTRVVGLTPAQANQAMNVMHQRDTRAREAEQGINVRISLEMLREAGLPIPEPVRKKPRNASGSA